MERRTSSVKRALVVADALVQLGEQRRGEPLALLVDVDGDVHHVPDRVVARADQVADAAARRRATRRQADARLLGELEHEHRQRPRRREHAPLDRDHLRQVRVGERAGSRSAGGVPAARRAVELIAALPSRGARLQRQLGIGPAQVVGHDQLVVAHGLGAGPARRSRCARSGAPARPPAPPRCRPRRAARGSARLRRRRRARARPRARARRAARRPARARARPAARAAGRRRAAKAAAKTSRRRASITARTPATPGTARAARARSRLGTATSSTDSDCARPRAVATPTRRPVKPRARADRDPIQRRAVDARRRRAARRSSRAAACAWPGCAPAGGSSRASTMRTVGKPQRHRGRAGRGVDAEHDHRAGSSERRRSTPRPRPPRVAAAVSERDHAAAARRARARPRAATRRTRCDPVRGSRRAAPGPRRRGRRGGRDRGVRRSARGRGSGGRSRTSGWSRIADAERPRRAAHERRLTRAELPADEHDVSVSERRGQLRAQRFGLDGRPSAGCASPSLDSRACLCATRRQAGQKQDRPAGEWCAGRSLLLEGWRQDLHRQHGLLTLGPGRFLRQGPK